MSASIVGLGPMGQALAGALLDAGVGVTVWNRTESKAAPLRVRGAHWAATPAAAFAASDVTLVNVVDHAAFDEVLAAAGASIGGRDVVGLTSDTPEAARRTAVAVSAAGGRYLDGAILTPTPTIGTPAASLLFAGPRALFDAHRATFDALGSPTWLGTEYGRAASYDVALLDLFWTSVGGFLHAQRLAAANGVGAEELLPHALGIVGILPAIFAEFAERLRHDAHGDSHAPMSSIAVSLRHLIAASADADVEADALQALQRDVDAAVSAGHGGDEITRIAQPRMGRSG